MKVSDETVNCPTMKAILIGLIQILYCDLFLSHHNIGKSVVEKHIRMMVEQVLRRNNLPKFLGAETWSNLLEV